jgi:hypothetical protein
MCGSASSVRLNKSPLRTTAFRDLSQRGLPAHNTLFLPWEDSSFRSVGRPECSADQLSEMFLFPVNSENRSGRGWGTHIEKQERQAVVVGDRGSQVQVNHFPLTANALAVSQLTGIFAVQAHDAAA